MALLSPEMRLLAEQFGLFGLSVKEVTKPIQQAAQPISALQQRIDEMTAQILDARFATDLEAEALAALTPEMRALAEELGLFGLRVEDVAEVVAAATDEVVEALPPVSLLEEGIAGSLLSECLKPKRPESLRLRYWQDCRRKSIERWRMSLGILKKEVKETDEEIRTKELAGMGRNDRLLSILDARISTHPQHG